MYSFVKEWKCCVCAKTKIEVDRTKNKDFSKNEVYLKLKNGTMAKGAYDNM